MKIESKLPSPSLSHLIKEISYTNIQLDGKQRHEQVAIDDGCYDFIFIKGEGIILTHGEDSNIEIANGALAFHKLKPPFKLSFEKELQLFVVKVQPWTNALFFSEFLEPGVLELDSLYGDEIKMLYQSIFQADDIEQKVGLFESFIQSLELREEDSFALVKAICEKIYESKGAIKVNNLVDQFKLNRQLLNKKFKKQVNYTIKQFIMIVRVMSLVKHKINHPDLSLTEVAHYFEYTDQAHFNNDFKKVCGLSPSAFFKNLPVFFHRHKKG